LSKGSVGIEDLSPLGKYGKEPQRAFEDTHNSSIDLLKAMAGGYTNQLIMAALQGVIYNYFTFPGVKRGDFSYVFSILHESAHWAARLTHSGVVQDELAKQAHKTLYTLATKRLSRAQIVRLWKEFAQTNKQIVRLAQKLEPIEEIFATYLAMCLLPTEGRTQVREAIDTWLKEEKWDKAYEAFVEACANYRNSLLVSPLFVFEAVCRMLEQVDIDGAELLCTFAKIRKVVWSHIKIIKQEHGSNLDEFKLEGMAESEAAEEINRILEHAGIPPEAYWSAIDNMENHIFKRIYEAVTKGSLLSDEELGILFAPFIKLEGQSSSGEITPLIFSLGFQKEDKDKLSPSIRVFCESLRQQLTKPCGIVCAFAYKEQACCGRKELLLSLSRRLPEEDKSNYEEPNCDSIR
jgi:hypothetical protein